MECYREASGTECKPERMTVRQVADSGQAADLSELWGQLAAGRHSIVTSFCTEERCYVCLSREAQRVRGRRFLTERNMEVLRRILLGDPQKVVALELNLAPSTVSLIASRCLQALGVKSCIAKVPLLMVAAAHADGGASAPFDARQAEIVLEQGSFLAVSFRRPDTRLPRLLSGSRCEVARLRVEGFTHREIAMLRGTSPRTVANQLSATFRQLSVSGRIELLRRLIRDEAPSQKPANVCLYAASGAPSSRASSSEPSSRRGSPSSDRVGAGMLA